MVKVADTLLVIMVEVEVATDGLFDLFEHQVHPISFKTALLYNLLFTAS